MSDTITDGAPLATAKKQAGAADQATDALVENNRRGRPARLGRGDRRQGHDHRGLHQQVHVAAAGVLRQSIPAEIHRGMAEPGSSKRSKRT